MPAFLYSTPCNCIFLHISNLSVIDSEKLPEPFAIFKLVINVWDDYEINEVFETKAEFILWLNSTFVPSNGFTGSFSIDGDFIVYSNPENFETIEIVAILETSVIIFRMGNALEPNKAYITIPNTSVITDANLLGIEVLSVQVDSSMRQPITEIGWIHDPLTGTITFPVDMSPEDVNIYVTTKQIPL